ncbi:histidine kinase [Methylobacterium sp. Leaf118]|uniref:histidine kinase n=1 Tax=Methylobacterium sp. Leaf118 TaxID=2876562 RepID=UPI001E64835C|nr:histidine kinase [Methylobacterium sp. Leaf118]
MADYYPLLARALGALPDRTPALRKAVYDRARSALIAQLRSLDPPVPEADIELERKALDKAIQRLETEYGEPPAAAEPEAAKPPTPAVSIAKPEPPVAPPPPAPPPPAPPPAAPTPEPFMPPASLPDDMLPEPGPPVDAEPFVPPPRRPRPEDGRESPEGDARPEEPGALPPTPPPAEGEDATLGEAANGRQRPRIDVVAPPAERSRFLRNLFVGGVLAAVIALIAVAAFFLRDQPGDLQRSAATSQENPPEAPDAKFADRVGGERSESEARPRTVAPAQPTQPEVTVSQRAVLYEENTADPRSPPASVTGHAVWRLEAVNGQQGEPLQNALRTTIEYPEAGLTLTMTMRRNRDTTLPASHTIELAFTNYGPGAKRAVQNIGLLQPKEEESSRGAPVSGLPVRVRENLFLIGLSSLKSDVDRNTDLMLHRNWFDLPISYTSGTRAILTFEKGNAGANAMQAAFDQWRD